jgi:hypothetical protein
MSMQLANAGVPGMIDLASAHVTETLKHLHHPAWVWLLWFLCRLASRLATSGVFYFIFIFSFIFYNQIMKLIIV